MAIQFSENTLEFPLTTGQVATASNINVFSGPVKKVYSIVMRGYDMGYPNEDRPLHEIQAQLLPVSLGGTATGDPNNNPPPGSFIDQTNHAVVHVNGLLLVDDDSGNKDDQYHGIIDYTVIAEV